MKRMLMLMGLSLCLLILLSATGVVQAEQSKLLQSCQRYQRVLTTPADLSVEQRALLVVTLAAAETRTNDPQELQEAYRQVMAPGALVLTSDTSYNWVSSAWQNDQKTTYTYHGTKETSATDADWNGSAWRDTSRHLTTYDGSGMLDTMTTQEMQAGAWVNADRSIFVYHASDSSHMILQQWRDSVGGVWVNYMQIRMTNESGRLATTTFRDVGS